MTTLDCTICKRPRVIHRIDPAAHGAHAVDVVICQVCDVRKCTNGHPVRDIQARKCAACGELL